jgi:hypothetical protein
MFVAAIRSGLTCNISEVLSKGFIYDGPQECSVSLSHDAWLCLCLEKRRQEQEPDMTPSAVDQLVLAITRLPCKRPQGLDMWPSTDEARSLPQYTGGCVRLSCDNLDQDHAIQTRRQ